MTTLVEIMNHVFYAIMYIIIIYNTIGESRQTPLRAFYWFWVSILYFDHGLFVETMAFHILFVIRIFYDFCYGLRFRKNEGS